MRSEEWASTTFGALISLGALQIGDGHRAKLSELGGDGPVFFRAGLLSSAGFQLDGADRFYEHVKIPPSKFARAGDTFVTTKGNSVGRTGFMPPGIPQLVYSPHLSYWRSADNDVIDNRFLRYWARSPEFLTQLQAMAHGTDMAPYLSLVDQKSLSVSLPPVQEQARIAAVLSTLDDKIDSNRRLAALLEETAATLFRARFVDFVGVEELDESAIGPVPKGWRVGTIGDLAVQHREFVRGENRLPYIGLDAMPRQSTVLSDWIEAGAPTGQAARFYTGDILFGKLRPYFQKVGVAPIEGRCSTEVLVLQPSDDQYYGILLGHVASTAFIDHCVAISRGTRMPRAEWSDAKQFKVAIPPPEMAGEFTGTVRGLYAYIRALTFETRTLVATRDELLPKLISGEITVPAGADVEDVLEAAAV